VAIESAYLGEVAAIHCQLVSHGETAKRGVGAGHFRPSRRHDRRIATVAAHDASFAMEQAIARALERAQPRLVRVGLVECRAIGVQLAGGVTLIGERAEPMQAARLVDQQVEEAIELAQSVGEHAGTIAAHDRGGFGVDRRVGYRAQSGAEEPRAALEIGERAAERFIHARRRDRARRSARADRSAARSGPAARG